MSAFTWWRAGLRSGWGTEAAGVTTRGHRALTVSLPRVPGRGPRCCRRPPAAVRHCCRPGNRVGLRVPGRQWGDGRGPARRAGDQTVGDWEGPRAPGRACVGAGRASGFPPAHTGCSRELPWRGCPHSSRASADGIPPGGNPSGSLRPCAPRSRRPSARLSARLPELPGSWGGAARGDAADRSAWVRACSEGAGPRSRVSGLGRACAVSWSLFP